jgi:hypothetical protein
LILTWKHPHPRKDFVDLAPLDHELQHAAQDFQPPVDTGDRQLGLAPLRNEPAILPVVIASKTHSDSGP